MYKKIIVILMVLSLLFVAGCQNEKQNDKDNTNDDEIEINNTDNEEGNKNNNSEKNKNNELDNLNNDSNVEENIENGEGIMISINEAEKAKGFNPEYENKVMPVGMWVSPPYEEINNERYKEIKESGINFVIGFTEHIHGMNGIKKALDAAQANDLKFLVRDLRVQNIKEENLDLLEDIYPAYKDHPAYMGHVIVDEPGAEKFDLLQKMAQIYREVVPDGLFYVNMLPTYSSMQQRGIDDYEEFITTYIEKVKPKVLSYDHYPLLNITEDTIEEYTWDYFYNLDVIRKIANKYDIPYYLFIQTMWYGNTRRDPNEDEIRWQVNMSLTFGAKGIQYFTYWTPKADGVTTFGDAMIDLEGNKTKHYYDVQKVNKELEWIDDILLASKCVGVIPHLEEKPYMDKPLETFEPLSSIEGDNAMIGCFIDGMDNKKLLVTNESYKESANVILQFDISNIEKISVVKKGIRETYLTKDTNGKLEIHLDKSEAILIEMY